jgi:hypothetical protein
MRSAVFFASGSMGSSATYTGAHHQEGDMPVTELDFSGLPDVTDRGGENDSTMPRAAGLRA